MIRYWNVTVLAALTGDPLVEATVIIQAVTVLADVTQAPVRTVQPLIPTGVSHTLAPAGTPATVKVPTKVEPVVVLAAAIVVEPAKILVREVAPVREPVIRPPWAVTGEVNV